MSGYAKRWASEAKGWLEANPDPNDPMTHIPGGCVNEPDDLESFDQKILSLAKRAGIDPSKVTRSGKPLSPNVQHVVDEFREIRADLVGERKRLTEKLGTLRDRDDTLRRRLDCAISVSGPGVSAATADFDAVKPLLGPWLVRWARDGYNVFDLSADFVAAMLLTDPSALCLESVRLPFSGLLMLIPDRFAGTFTKIHIYEQPLTTKTDETSVTADPETRLISIDATNGERWLSTVVCFDDLAREGFEAFDALDASKLADGEQAAIDTIRRIALGALAYFVSVERSTTRRGAPARSVSSTAPRPIYWDIARTVRIDPNLVRAARAGSREVALRLKHRHIVRGHYRQQPIGEGRKERKTIWIAPFWKGPADGAAIVHTYKPGAPDPAPGVSE